MANESSTVAGLIIFLLRVIVTFVLTLFIYLALSNMEFISNGIAIAITILFTFALWNVMGDAGHD